MAKRIAEKELTDKNWDQEEEAEEVEWLPEDTRVWEIRLWTWQCRHAAARPCRVGHGVLSFRKLRPSLAFLGTCCISCS